MVDLFFYDKVFLFRSWGQPYQDEADTWFEFCLSYDDKYFKTLQFLFPWKFETISFLKIALTLVGSDSEEWAYSHFIILNTWNYRTLSDVYWISANLIVFSSAVY